MLRKKFTVILHRVNFHFTPGCDSGFYRPDSIFLIAGENGRQTDEENATGRFSRPDGFAILPFIRAKGKD